MGDKFDLNVAFGDLEAKVRALEDPEIGLEDSFRLYKEGMDLIKKCNESIDAVEKQVLVLEEGGGVHEFQRKS